MPVWVRWGLSICIAMVLAVPEGMRHAMSADEGLVDLGRALFFDPRLSRDGTVSCASCHEESRGFAEDRARSLGVAGQTGSRNAPSLLAVNAYTSLNWDGRTRTLESQVLQPFVTPVEHGLASLVVLTDILGHDDDTAHRFITVFGADAPAVTPEHVAVALAAYVRSLGMGRTRLERFLFGGETDVLSESAQRGLALFTGAAGCAQCHRIEADAAPLTDNRFHSVGIGLSGSLERLPQTIAALERVPADQIGPHLLADQAMASLGRYVVTRMPQDIGRFRTPSLRAVARTAPYFHDGSVATLGEAMAIEIYYRGSADRAVALSIEEQRDLLAFLESLSD